MDNNTPNYAKWIPEAGGYVQNGTVVSTTPVYDNTGRQVVDLDASRLQQQNTQLSGTAAAAASGVTTANQKGSSQDVNQAATDIGSLGSMSDNTAMTTTGVLDTNATKSPLVKEPVLSPLDQAKKDYEYMVATNNLQGQINALQQLSNLEGVDYSAQISNLQQQRDIKIKDIDDQYLAAYNQALAAGDTAKADQILAQQDAWRQSVGYQGAMQNMRQREEQALRIEWEDTYRAGIDQITQSILQLTGNMLNFQYNPNTDMQLQIAQGYAVGKVKEQMNATGMYYSSMTQGAITRAVAELVPVYEKMAKDELKDNLSILQSTANYLMNLEESQFKLWEAQIEMQWNANNERRKEVTSAIDTANARGYFSNDEAALLGVAPGTLSPSAREHLQSVQEQIDKEERALQQDKALARYKTDLAKEEYAYQKSIAAQYPTTSTSSTVKEDGMSYSDFKTYTEDLVNSGESVENVEKYIDSTNFSNTQKDALKKNIEKSTNENTQANGIDFSKPLTGTMTKTDLQKSIEESASQTDFDDSKLFSILEDAIINGKSYDDVVTALKGAKVDAGGIKSPVFDTTLLDSLSGDNATKIKNLYNYYGALELENNGEDFFQTVSEDNTLPTKVKEAYISAYTRNYLLDDLEFNDKEKDNMAELDRAYSKINSKLGYMTTAQKIKAYETLFDEIMSAGTTSKPFDIKKGDVMFNAGWDKSVIKMEGGDAVGEFFDFSDKGDKSKQLAMVYIINKLAGKNGSQSPLSSSEKNNVVGNLTYYLREKAKTMDGYSGLKNSSVYETIAERR